MCPSEKFEHYLTQFFFVLALEVYGPDICTENMIVMVTYYVGNETQYWNMTDIVEFAYYLTVNSIFFL